MNPRPDQHRYAASAGIIRPRWLLLSVVLHGSVIIAVVTLGGLARVAEITAPPQPKEESVVVQLFALPPAPEAKPEIVAEVSPPDEAPSALPAGILNPPIELPKNSFAGGASPKFTDDRPTSAAVVGGGVSVISSPGGTWSAGEGEGNGSGSSLPRSSDSPLPGTGGGSSSGSGFGGGTGDGAMPAGAPYVGARKLVAPEPVYPRLSRENGEEGTVRLQVEVLETGAIGDIRVLNNPGHPRLVAAAIDYARGCQFSPALRDGAATRSYLIIPVRFVLE